MFRCKFADVVIASAGYDALCATLEIEFSGDGQIWQYAGVPEELWYRFRQERVPEKFFHYHIKGCYEEKRVLPE